MIVRYACLVFIGLISGDAVVTSISPDRIGLGGGTININGDGFATDGFSQFDPDKGNKVLPYRFVGIQFTVLLVCRLSLPMT